MSQTFTAVVMSAQRVGVIDPIAERAGVSHKCVADIAGKPLLLWVLEALTAATQVGEILVMIEDEQVVREHPAFADILAQGHIKFAVSGESLFTSVELAAEQISFPMLVTTGDNSSLLPDYVDHFCIQVRDQDTEVAFAMTPQPVLGEKFPEYANRPTACYQFKDGGYANCNLYAIQTYENVKAAGIFAGGGSFRKTAWRFISAFGLINLIRYRRKSFTLAGAAEVLGRRLGMKAIAVPMPFAEAAVDVDNFVSFEIVEDTLRQRQAA